MEFGISDSSAIKKGMEGREWPIPRMLVDGIVSWRGLGAGPRQEGRSKERELSLLRLAEPTTRVSGVRSSAASACGAPTETAAV